MSKSVSKSSKKSEAVAEVIATPVEEVKSDKPAKKAVKSKDVVEATPVVAAPVAEEKPKKVAKGKKAEAEAAPAAEPVAEETEGAPAPRTRRQVTLETVTADFSALRQSLENLLSEVNEKKVPSSRAVKRIIKSVTQLESDVSKVSKTKRRTQRAANVDSGFMKPVKISKDMAKFTGWAPDQLRSRNDVTKHICNYIKENNLQDPSDRRRIVPDPKLAKLLSYDSKVEKPLTYPLLQRFMQPHFISSTSA